MDDLSDLRGAGPLQSENLFSNAVMGTDQFWCYPSALLEEGRYGY